MESSWPKEKIKVHRRIPSLHIDSRTAESKRSGGQGWGKDIGALRKSQSKPGKEV